MNEWGARLTAARMSRGITQEQLAGGLNLPVELIISWEQGQNIPDDNVRAMLSQALQTDLLTLPPNAMPKPQVPTPQTTEPKPAEKKPINWVAILAGLVAVGAAVAMLILQPWKQPAVPVQGASVGTQAPAQAVTTTALPEGVTAAPVVRTELPAPAANAEEFSLDWFRQNNAPTAGEPFITITSESDPLQAIHATDFKSGGGWLWIFYLKETNGAAFHAKSFTQVVFRSADSKVISEFSADNMTAWWGSSDIAANDTQSVTGGLEYQDAIGVGCVVTGTDDNGKELSFRGFFALDSTFVE